MNNEPDYDNLYFEEKKMTQKIFDTDNAEDMALLWSILPDDICNIEKWKDNHLKGVEGELFYCDLIEIDWHHRNRITRPIQEATEADVGKLCVFWNGELTYIGKLCHIKDTDTGKYYEMGAPVVGNLQFLHCRRLTKQEIEELC